MKKGKENIKSKEHSLEMMESLTNRYIEAEEFIMNLGPIESLFFFRKKTKFLDSRKKYK
jgi:hypothetical protein